MQTWAIEPALRAGDVRAIPITAHGIRRQWSAATLKAAGTIAHVDGFIELLAEPRDAGSPASALASWPGATKVMGRMRAAVTSR